MLSLKQPTLAAIFLVTSSACFAQLAEKTPFFKTYEKLNTLYEEEKYDKIINLEKKILKQAVEDTTYADAMYFLADSYYFTGDLNKAIEYARQEIKINTAIRGENYSDKEVSLEWLGLTLMEAGKYVEAEQYLASSSKLYQANFGSESEEYVESVFNLGDVFRAANKIETAAKLYEGLNKSLKRAHPMKARTLANLGEIYAQQGNYSAAERTLFRAKKSFEESVPIDSSSYVASLTYIVNLFRTKGQYRLAEEYLSKALDFIEHMQDREYYEVNLLHYSAVVNDGLGNYETAVSQLNKLETLVRAWVGTEHPDYGITLFNMASILNNMDRSSAADSVYTIAQKIILDNMGTDNVTYSDILRGRARALKKMGRHIQATAHFNEVIQIQERTVGKEHPFYASTLHHRGDLAAFQGNTDGAKADFLEALDIRRKTLGKSHPKYAETLRKLASLHWHLGEISEAKDIYKDLFDNYFDQINNYFAILSEDEKASFFFNKLKPSFEEFNNFAIENRVDNPELIGDMYNYQLRTKGLILSSTNKVHAQILSSGDSSLIKRYDAWIVTKEQLSKVMATAGQKENDLDVADSLRTAANQMERELSLASDQFAKTFDRQPITWQQVRNRLKPGEAAIEIVRYRDYSPANSGSYSNEVHYAGLVIRHDTVVRPQVVIIPSGLVLETRYLANYRNAVRFKVEDHYSYNQYWKPLTPVLEGIQKLYFSPDGVYNIVSLNSLLNPETQKFIIEEIFLEFVTNTNELVKTKKESRQTGNAYLIGFPNYNRGMSEADSSQQSGSNEELDRSARGTRGGMRGLRGTLSRYIRSNALLADLPGTKREVETIAVLHESANHHNEVLMENEAAEENLKKLVNPKTLHIATHGFFLDDEPPPSREGGYVDNPLLRSGLILAGANSFLMGEEHHPNEDGILTAYEAMNMTLDETEIVVLSACETGLGTVSNGEGVYGLQRAFRVAGAKAIIMSLWQVDDDATQELMTQFYTFWLESNDKHDAFYKAQLALKEKYPAPFYWGAFIMVGE